MDNNIIEKQILNNLIKNNINIKEVSISNSLIDGVDFGGLVVDVKIVTDVENFISQIGIKSIFIGIIENNLWEKLLENKI